tara:strand:+ start:1666 stop:2178 length:513 start_codon:yes stop_codon:yes gene_type:complete
LKKNVDRRSFLYGLGLLGAGVTLGFPVLSDTKDIFKSLKRSELIYLSPLLTNGSLSKCQAEIWFVCIQENVFLVTAKNAWRAEAVRGGLNVSRIWVGDVGRWRYNSTRHLRLPSYDAVGNFESGVDIRKRVLEAMGKKYREEWPVWGPRFSDGLEDGSRVMLKYVPRFLS